MSGRRHEMDSIGESYEVFAESVLSRIASLTRIGTKQDFGTDTYCLPRISEGTRMEAVTELCLLQIKGGSSPLDYGGIKKQKWQSHEFEWLKNLWAPLYLATVDLEYRKVNLFSLWPIWWVMWKSDAPFKIVCSWRESVRATYDYSEPTKKKSKAGLSYGDGYVWKIDLGCPILQLSHKNLNDKGFRNRVVKIFRQWIRVDRETVARFHAKIPFIEANSRWRTNQLRSVRREQLWIDDQPGKNIESIARATVPGLLSLGAHLQHQGNPDAFGLIEILDWIEDKGYGNLITPTLLTNLKKAREEKVSPKTYL